MVALLVGVALAAGVGWFATVVGLDRDRAFYPTVMIVIAMLYVLFAAIGGSATAMLIEAVIGTGFIAMAVAGFNGSLWLVALALTAHGIFDLVHRNVVANPGVPSWWPSFCGAYDVAAGAYLAVLIRTDRIRARR